MHLKLRKRILPQRFVDFLNFMLIFIALPLVFMFDMVVVLPRMHKPGSYLYYFTFALASFLLHNILGNFIFCVLIDNSVDFDEKIPPKEKQEENGWHMCKSCEKLAPPRAWHCRICRSCILKRDHHCIFTGCCIGHNNHRYFMLFLSHLAIGSIYAFIYNSIFIWVRYGHVYCNWRILNRILRVLSFFIMGIDTYSVYLLFYLLNILAVLYAVILLIYHLPVVLKGGVSFERKNGYAFDMGLRKNLQQVFGVRMHLVWLSPFVHSQLPNNGYSWSKLS